MAALCMTYTVGTLIGGAGNSLLVVLCSKTYRPILFVAVCMCYFVTHAGRCGGDPRDACTVPNGEAGFCSRLSHVAGPPRNKPGDETDIKLNTHPISGYMSRGLCATAISLGKYITECECNSAQEGSKGSNRAARTTNANGAAVITFVRSGCKSCRSDGSTNSVTLGVAAEMVNGKVLINGQKKLPASSPPHRASGTLHCQLDPAHSLHESCASSPASALKSWLLSTPSKQSNQSSCSSSTTEMVKTFSPETGAPGTIDAVDELAQYQMYIDFVVLPHMKKLHDQVVELEQQKDLLMAEVQQLQAQGGTVSTCEADKQKAEKATQAVLAQAEAVKQAALAKAEENERGRVAEAAEQKEAEEVRRAAATKAEENERGRRVAEAAKQKEAEEAEEVDGSPSETPGAPLASWGGKRGLTSSPDTPKNSEKGGAAVLGAVLSNAYSARVHERRSARSTRAEKDNMRTMKPLFNSIKVKLDSSIPAESSPNEEQCDTIIDDLLSNSECSVETVAWVLNGERYKGGTSLNPWFYLLDCVSVDHQVGRTSKGKKTCKQKEAVTLLHRTLLRGNVELTLALQRNPHSKELLVIYPTSFMIGDIEFSDDECFRLPSSTPCHDTMMFDAVSGATASNVKAAFELLKWLITIRCFIILQGNALGRKVQT